MTASLAPVQVPTTAEALVADFLAGRSAATHRAYSQCLLHFARWRGAPGAAAAARDLLADGPVQANWLAAKYRDAQVAEGRAPATVNLRLSALRALVAMARRAGMVTWALEVDGVRSRTYRDTRGPGIAAVQQVLDATRPVAGAAAPTDARDRALVRLLFDLALRRCEVVSLDVDHVDLAGRRLAVLGKGRTEREWLPLAQPTAEALAAWILVRGAAPGPLFRACRSGRWEERLAPGGVNLILQRLGRRAGVEGLRPHGFRHTAITAALDATGGDVRTVQRYSRHADVRTLQRYDDERSRDGVSTLVAAALA